MIKTAEERIAVEGAYNHSDRVLNTVTVSFAKYHAMIEEAEELRAAYEALKAENEALRQESANYENASKITNSWNLEIADSNGNLRQENEALRKQVEMLLGSARKTVLALAHASIHDPLYTAAYDELSESIKLASKKWRSK